MLTVDAAAEVREARNGSVQYVRDISKGGQVVVKVLHRKRHYYFCCWYTLKIANKTVAIFVLLPKKNMLTQEKLIYETRKTIHEALIPGTRYVLVRVRHFTSNMLSLQRLG